MAGDSHKARVGRSTRWRGSPSEPLGTGPGPYMGTSAIPASQKASIPLRGIVLPKNAVARLPLVSVLGFFRQSDLGVGPARGPVPTKGCCHAL